MRRVMLAPYRNMVHAVREIAREEGFRGFYRGIAPSLLLVRISPRKASVPFLESTGSSS